MTEEGPVVIILAAGSGTRMKSKTPKVLHTLGGRSMIGHVLAATSEVGPRRVVTVVGHGREEVGGHVRAQVPDALLAVQESQEGTGHAVRIALETLQAEDGELTGTVLVTTGDTPLLLGSTLRRLLEHHADTGCAVTLLTGEVANPFGYGRVVRGSDGSVEAIVEEKDAEPEVAAIREINASIYAFDATFLARAIPRLSNDNAKGEYYLTDVVAIARADDAGVAAFAIDDVLQTEGANDRAQLAALAAHLNRRTLDRWMRDGVSVVDPTTTWVDVTVTLEPDSTLLPGVQLLGATTIAADAVVGPDSTLKDVEVGRGAKVVRAHAELAVIGDDANVGPFSYLRPGTVVGAGGKIGAFVETKNATLGPSAKVPHLSYVGDAEIGEGTNIGAGTIFANYDGVTKHRTSVGRHAKTGSNNTFIAPVEIGDGAVTGGGSVIREDVPPGALAVSAGPQRNVEGWVAKRRPGTPAADAAEEADSQQSRAASHRFDDGEPEQQST